MAIATRDTRIKATEIMHEAYGPDAKFRDGQLEAIEAVFANRRVLVVQKTGWGKSLVYFVVARLLKEQGRGLTVVVSPLLALMDNQPEAAEGLGARVPNSNVKGEARQRVLDDLADDRADVLFTTPETLLRGELQNLLPRVRIGLFVIDEAHCLSDWGRDFRPKRHWTRASAACMSARTSLTRATSTSSPAAPARSPDAARPPEARRKA